VRREGVIGRRRTSTPVAVVPVITQADEAAGSVEAVDVTAGALISNHLGDRSRDGSLHRERGAVCDGRRCQRDRRARLEKYDGR